MSTLKANNYTFAYEDRTVSTNKLFLYDGPFSLHSFQGKNYGFLFGGRRTTSATGAAFLSYFPFATGVSAFLAAPVGITRPWNFTIADYVGIPSANPTGMFGGTGHSSMSDGYATSGGTLKYNVPQGSPEYFGVQRGSIEKFSYSTLSRRSLVGTINDINRVRSVGQSSLENGYISGGVQTTNTPVLYNTIEKFPFSSDSNSSDVGDLTVSRAESSGTNSLTHGYTSGGLTSYTPSPTNFGSNVIDKFSFASNSNASDVGDLTVSRYRGVGISSEDHSYNTGGGNVYVGPMPAPSVVNIIDRFPFATDANAADVGDLYVPTCFQTGISSINAGYIVGGFSFYNDIPSFIPSQTGGYRTTVQKFSYASGAGSANSETTLSLAQNAMAIGFQY